MGWGGGGGRGVVVRRSGDDEGALGGPSQQLQRERHKTMALHERHNV